MKRPLLSRILDKLKRRKPAPPEAKAPAKRLKRRTESSFEPLEGRIAPAILLNPTTVLYTDTDGDLVTVKFSKAIFTATGAVLNGQLDSVLKFNTGNARTGSDGGNTSTAQELQTIDLSTLAAIGQPNVASGTSISVTAVKQNNLGDDHVNIGYIKAASSSIFGIPLGAVVVDGDLGQIDAGDPGKTTGLASLTVLSFGTKGTTTQAANGSLESNITGAIGSLTVQGDYTDAVLKVVGGTTQKVLGKIGALSIGGTLGLSATNTSNDTGLISTASNIGSVKIGAIYGGAGSNTGQIKAVGTIGNVSITNDIRGGAGKDSGEINGQAGIGNVTIAFNLWAGTGENSGRITSNGSIGAIKLGNLHGDATITGGDSGKNAATIFAGANIASLTTNEAILGGKGEGSGSVLANGKIAKATINSTISGGIGKSSGRIFAGNLGAVTIGQTITGGAGDDSGTVAAFFNIGSVTVKNSLNATGAVIAGTGVGSGAINAGGSITKLVLTGALDGSTALAKDGAGSIHAGGNIAAITVNGALKGGLSELNGAISADGNIGTLKITGGLLGAAGTSSASVIAGGIITNAAIIGNLSGSTGVNSGSVFSGNDTTKVGTLGKITVSGALLGGGGDSSGAIRSGGKIVALTIGTAGAPVANKLSGGIGSHSGSVVALEGIGTATFLGAVQGGTGTNSGSIIAQGAVGTLKISAGLTGAGGAGSGSIQVRDILSGPTMTPGDLGTVIIGGAVVGNAGDGSGQIMAEGSLKSLTIGALTGQHGVGSGSILIGQGLAALTDDFTKIGGAGAITINGQLAGGPGSGSGVIEVGGRIASLKITGGTNDTSIKTGRDIGSLTIAGGVNTSLITALGQAKTGKTTDIAIGKVSITGDVNSSRILAGYDRFGNAANGSAQIEAVNVTGNWTASSIAAGVVDTNGDGFGNGDDSAIAQGTIISKIAGIVITGTVTGTGGAGDQFGFVAQQIYSLKIGGVLQALTTGKDVIPLAGIPPTNDTTIREVA